MALETDEIRNAALGLAAIGDEARALAEAIKAGREDGTLDEKERARIARRLRRLARAAAPIALQLALDALD